MLAQILTIAIRRTIGLLLLTCLVALVPSAASARSTPRVLLNGPWTQLGPAATSDGNAASAGRVQALAIDPTNASTIYAGTFGGVYKRTVAAWTLLPSGLRSTTIGSLAIDSNHPNVIYAGTGKDNDVWGQPGLGILKSPDGGQTWAVAGNSDSVLHGAPVTGLYVNSQNSSIVVAAAEGGVFRSTDGGATWTNQLLVPFDRSRLAPDPANASVLYAGVVGAAADGIYKSGDAGATWNLLTNGPVAAQGDLIDPVVAASNDSRIYALVAGRNESTSLWRSNDAGATWTALTNPGGTGKLDIAEIAIDADNADIVDVGEVNINQSTDGGLTFHPPSFCGGDIRSLVTGPPGSHRAYAGTDFGYCQSLDGGLNWSSANNGLDATIAYYVSGESATHVLAGFQDLGLQAHDTAGLGPWTLGPNCDGFGVRIDPTNTNVMYGICGGFASGALKSLDSGASWVQMNNGVGPDFMQGYVLPLAMDPANSSTLLWPGANGHVALTTNGAQLWTVVNVPVLYTGELFSAAAVVNGALWVGTTYGNVWKSNDGGASWTLLPTPRIGLQVSSIGIDPQMSTHVVIGLRILRPDIYSSRPDVGKVLESVDGGSTWTDITGTLSGQAIGAVAIAGGQVLAGTDFGVNTYSRGTWQALGSKFPSVHVTDLEASHDGTLLFASTYGRGILMYTLSGPPAPPAAPSQVAGIAGESSATVYWAPQTANPTITGFTVTSSPGGFNATAVGSSTSAVVYGLTDGTSYTFTVTATNALGTSPPSATSNPVIPGRGAYSSLPPQRILDTRSTTPLGQATSRDVPILGHGGVPAAGVSDVVINVTVTNTTASSYLTIWPTGVPRPLASNLNWTAGQTVPNLVEVALGLNGQVTMFNAAGSTDVIFDIAGYVATPTVARPIAGQFVPVVPARVMDTRNGTGPVAIAPLGVQAQLDLKVTGIGGLPASGVDAVVLNVTATNPTSPSYLSVYPTGTARPTVSNLNFGAGQTVPNRVIAKVGSGGQLSFYNAAGYVDVVADVSGWFTDSTSTFPGAFFVGVTPARILDTRTTTSLGPGTTQVLPAAGAGGVPAMNAAVVPSGVVLNVTATNPTGASYLTVWPDGVKTPIASDLNFVAGQTVPNLVVVKLGSNGWIDILNAVGTMDVVVDVVGWYG